MYNVIMNTRKTEITEFGERLRRIRREKGLTQNKLAQLSGISRRMIVHYESYVKMPPVEKVKLIAEVLEVSADELIGTSKKSREQKKKEDLSYSIMKRVRVIETLPKRDRDMVFSLINSLAEKNKLKQKK